MLLPPTPFFVLRKVPATDGYNILLFSVGQAIIRFAFDKGHTRMPFLACP